MSIAMQPIGFVHTDAQHVPRHWSVSDVKGREFVTEVRYGI